MILDPATEHGLTGVEYIKYHGKIVGIFRISGGIELTTSASTPALMRAPLDTPMGTAFSVLTTTSTAAIAALTTTRKFMVYTAHDLLNTSMSRDIKGLSVMASAVTIKNSSSTTTRAGTMYGAVVQATASPDELTNSAALPSGSTLSTIAPVGDMVSVNASRQGELKTILRNPHAPERLNPMGATEMGRRAVMCYRMTGVAGATGLVATVSTAGYEVGAATSLVTDQDASGLEAIPAAAVGANVTITSRATITATCTYTVYVVDNLHTTGPVTDVKEKCVVTFAAGEPIGTSKVIRVPYVKYGIQVVEVNGLHAATSESFDVTIEAYESGAKEYTQRAHVFIAGPAADAQSFSIKVDMVVLALISAQAAAAANVSENLGVLTVANLDTMDVLLKSAGHVFAGSDVPELPLQSKLKFGQVFADDVAFGGAGRFSDFLKAIKRAAIKGGKGLSAFARDNHQLLSAASAMLPSRQAKMLGAALDVNSAHHAGDNAQEVALRLGVTEWEEQQARKLHRIRSKPALEEF
jgi:hypothetical protein